MKMHVLAATVLGCSAGLASATLIVDEPFNYTAGTSLVVGSGSTVTTAQSPDGVHYWSFRGTATGDQTTLAGTLAQPTPLTASTGNTLQYGGTGETDRLNIFTHNTGALYYSFPLKITDLGTITASQIICGFNNDNSTVGSMNPGTIGAVLWAQPTDDVKTDTNYHTAYTLGIGTTSAAGSRVFDTTQYAVGSTVFVIGEYDFSTGFAAAQTHLWIYDPATDTLPDAQPTPTVSGVTGSVSGETNLLSFLTYQTNTSSANSFGNNGINMGELRIGTSWADVTGVPEPTGLSMVLIGAAGLVGRRTKRKA